MISESESEDNEVGSYNRNRCSICGDYIYDAASYCANHQIVSSTVRGVTVETQNDGTFIEINTVDGGSVAVDMAVFTQAMHDIGFTVSRREYSDEVPEDRCRICNMAESSCRCAPCSQCGDRPNFCTSYNP